jgi:HAD superfamily hydrolase (TIGR01450 family)
VTLAERYDAFLIDLDGVVWRGDEPIPSAAATIAQLRKMRKYVVFVTNNASRSPRDYAAKLMRMSIPTDPLDIVTSAHAVVEHLDEIGLHDEDRVHVCAAKGLAAVLRAHGYTPTRDVTDVQALVVAWNPSFGFNDLRRASDVARSGVPFVAANRDATYPSEDGLLPGTGAILAAIEIASGRQATVVGKPEPNVIRIALERTRSDPTRTLFLGDRADTDIAGARAAGVPVALVLTGVTGAADVRSLAESPDFVLDDIGGVLASAEPNLRTASSEPRLRPVPSDAEQPDQDEAGEEPPDVSEEGDAARLIEP